LEAGKITVSHTKTGNCVYRLTSDFQCLKGATSAREKASQRWGSAARDGGGPRLETPPIYKEIKENIDHHQHTVNESFLSTCDDEFSISVFNETDCTEGQVANILLEKNKALVIESRAPSPLTPTVPNVPAAGIPRRRNTTAASSLPALTAAQAALAARLRHCAVNLRIAERLVREAPTEVIEKALAGLAARKEIRNPAGWLHDEIMSGGYKPPEAILASENRQRVQSGRAAEKVRVEAERDTQDKAGAIDRARLQALPPDALAALKAEAIGRLPAIIRDHAGANADFPPLRGEMVLILRERRERDLPRPIGRPTQEWGTFRREEPSTEFYVPLLPRPQEAPQAEAGPRSP